jgi:hypothetical protein
MRSSLQQLSKSLPVEARYKSKGAWQLAEISNINLDGSIDVKYHDGEVDFNLPPDCVRGAKTLTSMKNI